MLENSTCPWRKLDQLQADEASDQVILATEQMEDLNLTALKQQLQSKQDALQGKLMALQELQASLLHPIFD